MIFLTTFFQHNFIAGLYRYTINRQQQGTQWLVQVAYCALLNTWWQTLSSTVISWKIRDRPLDPSANSDEIHVPVTDIITPGLRFNLLLGHSLTFTIMGVANTTQLIKV